MFGDGKEDSREQSSVWIGALSKQESPEARASLIPSLGGGINRAGLELSFKEKQVSLSVNLEREMRGIFMVREI